jgi:hypothetical protein
MKLLLIAPAGSFGLSGLRGWSAPAANGTADKAKSADPSQALH